MYTISSIRKKEGIPSEAPEEKESLPSEATEEKDSMPSEATEEKENSPLHPRFPKSPTSNPETAGPRRLR